MLKLSSGDYVPALISKQGLLLSALELLLVESDISKLYCRIHKV